MTGEMFKSEVTRENFPLMFAIADAVKGTVEPFDQYQGPYVCVGRDIRAGSEPYAVAPTGLGVIRLWLCTDDGVQATIYNEAIEMQSNPFLLHRDDTEEYAVYAALSVIAGKQWTVLVLRPDHMWEGSVRDWTYQAHVIAPDVAGAEIAGREQAAKADGEDEPFDYAILVVYAGHLSDVADT